MGLDWSHPMESTKQHHPVSCEVESPREEKEEALQEQLAVGQSQVN